MQGSGRLDTSAGLTCPSLPARPSRPSSPSDPSLPGLPGGPQIFPFSNNSFPNLIITDQTSNQKILIITTQEIQLAKFDSGKRALNRTWRRFLRKAKGVRAKCERSEPAGPGGPWWQVQQLAWRLGAGLAIS